MSLHRNGVERLKIALPPTQVLLLLHCLPLFLPLHQFFLHPCLLLFVSLPLMCHFHVLQRRDSSLGPFIMSHIWRKLFPPCLGSIFKATMLSSGEGNAGYFILGQSVLYSGLMHPLIVARDEDDIRTSSVKFACQQKFPNWQSAMATYTQSYDHGSWRSCCLS